MCVSVCVCECVCMCVCVSARAYVCVREREKERVGKDADRRVLSLCRSGRCFVLYSTCLAVTIAGSVGLFTDGRCQSDFVSALARHSGLRVHQQVANLLNVY